MQPTMKYKCNLESLSDEVLLFLVTSLVQDGVIFVPQKYDYTEGRALANSIKDAMNRETLVRGIDVTSGTKLIATTYNLLP